MVANISTNSCTLISSSMSNNQLQPVKRQRKVNTIFLGELGTNPNNERADQLIKSSSSNDNNIAMALPSTSTANAELINAETGNNTDSVLENSLVMDVSLSAEEDSAEVVLKDLPSLTPNTVVTLRPLPLLSYPSAFVETNITRKEPILSVPSAQNELFADIKSTIAINRIDVVNTKTGRSAKVFAKSDRKTVWKMHISSHISHLNANSKWVILACIDSRLFIFHTNSGKLLAILSLNAPVSLLDLNDQVCVAITSNAEVYSWNLEAANLVARESFAGLLKAPGTTISKFYVSQEGVPFFVLNNNDAFVFSRNLSSWLSLNLGLGILNELLKNMEFITKLVPNGLLATLCPFFRDLKNKENAVLAEHVDSMTEAQIELLIEATKALNSPFELKFLTSLYIHRLAKNGSSSKLHEVIQALYRDSPAGTCGIAFDTFILDVTDQLQAYNINLEEILDEANDQNIDWSFLQ